MQSPEKLLDSLNAAKTSAEIHFPTNPDLGGAGGDDLIMGLTPGGLLLAMLFSLVGTSFLIYAKKKSDLLVGLCGVGLLTYTLFISSTLWLLLIGVLLSFLPLVLRRLGVDI